MADDGWNVVGVGGQPPAQPAARSAAAPGGGWDVVGVGGTHPSQPPPASPAPPAQPTEDHVDDWLSRHPILGAPINLLAGVGAGVEETGAGLDVLGRKLTGTQMTPLEQKFQTMAAKPTRGTVQAIGKGGEGIGEFFTGEELLGMLGRTGLAMNAGEKLKAASQLGETLAKHPYIAKALKIGLETVKSGTMAAGQEYAKTGGDTQAATGTGLTTAALTAGLGSVGVAGKALMDLAPGEKMLEGVRFPFLKSQINKAGKLIEGGDISDIAPKMAAQQQNAAQKILGNVASRATSTVLDAINNARQLIKPGEMDAAAAGAAPEGQPIFDLGARPITAEGEITPGKVVKESLTSPEEFAAAQKQREALADETITELGTKKATGKRLTPEEKQQLSDAYQAYAEPQQTLEPHQTTDPSEAISHLRDLKDFRNSPAYASLSDGERATFDQRYTKLRDQVDMYHSSPYRQPFAPIDTQSVASRVRTFGHAGDQIMAAAEPVFQKLNKLASGAMTDAREELESASQAVRSAKTPDAFNAGIERLDKANQALSSLVNEQSYSVSLGEAATARRAIDSAGKMYKLNAVFEHMMNGVTEEESQQGYSRVMTGNARNLQGWLNNPDNAKMLDGLIGQEGRNNLKELTLAMSKVSPQRHMAEAVKNISKIIDSNRWRQTGAALGGTAGLLLGPGALKGAAAGATTAEVMRQVIRYAATNPRIGNMLTFAVDHNIRPDIYAPLISRSIAEYLRPQGQLYEPGAPGQEQPQQGGQQQTPPEQEGRSQPLNPYKNPEDQPPEQSLSFNKQWARQGPYTTQLTPQEEGKFKQWVASNKVPWQDNPNADYDMRGYWRALQRGEAKQEYNAWDHTMHFPDTWKTPYSGTFSRESKYASPQAPEWKGDVLMTKDGRVVVDETPR